MDVGFGLPVSGSWATPENVVTIARRAEELGVRSLRTISRLLVPEPVQLDPAYHSVLDPVVALSFAAAVTDRVRLATGTVSMSLLPPTLLAKQLASLDVLSGGRAVAGVGLGWLPEEFVAAGVPYERRGARGEEYVAALRALWGPDPVSFAGEFYTVPTSMVLPKPVRPGGPPLLLGGAAEKALRRAGRIADGWLSSSRFDPDRLHESVAVVRDGAIEAGRDPASLEYVARGVVRDAPRSGPLTGPLDQVRSDLTVIAGQGITELFVDLNFDPTIGSPDADPAASMGRALEVLEALV